MWQAILAALGGIGDAIAGLFAWFSRKEQRDAGRDREKLRRTQAELERTRERLAAQKRVARADADDLERLLRDRADGAG